MMGIIQLAAASSVVQKASHMAQADPHGWTLTLVSVCVVFSVLIILYLAYFLTGAIFSKQQKKTSDTLTDEELCAIATALELYERDKCVHDNESGIITIKNRY